MYNYNYTSLPKTFNVHVISGYYDIDQNIKHKIHLISPLTKKSDEDNYRFYAFVVGGEEFSKLQSENKTTSSRPQDLKQMQISGDTYDLYISQHDEIEWRINNMKIYDENYVFLQIKDVTDHWFYIPINRLNFFEKHP